MFYFKTSGAPRQCPTLPNGEVRPFMQAGKQLDGLVV